MPWWVEPQRHMVVVVFVCMCVCVILQHAFLCNHNELSSESCNATTTPHSNTAKLARFLFYDFVVYLQHNVLTLMVIVGYPKFIEEQSVNSLQLFNLTVLFPQGR